MSFRVVASRRAGQTLVLLRRFVARADLCPKASPRLGSSSQTVCRGANLAGTPVNVGRLLVQVGIRALCSVGVITTSIAAAGTCVCTAGIELRIPRPDADWPASRMRAVDDYAFYTERSYQAEIASQSDPIVRHCGHTSASVYVGLDKLPAQKYDS